jgi:hypothetical protein
MRVLAAKIISKPHRFKIKESLALGLFIIWILFVFSHYFQRIPNPFLSLRSLFDFDRFAPVSWSLRRLLWSESLGIFLITGLSLLNTWWLGRIFRNWMSVKVSSQGIALGLDLGLGILSWSLFWLGTGLVRLWFPAFLGFVGILAAIPAIRLVFKEKDKISFWKTSPGCGWMLKTLGLTAIFYVLWAVLQSLLPETFYDSLNYFLGIPQFWIFQHGITDNPAHAYSGMFLGGSLYFTNGFYFGGTEAAKLLSLTFVLLCGVFAGAWAGEETGKTGGLAAFLLVVTFPLLYLNGWAVRVDGLLTLEMLLFFYSFWRFLEERHLKGFQPWGFLSALLAGFAVTIKPTAVIGIGSAFLASFFAGPRLTRKGYRVWIGMAGWTLLVSAPWLLKNWAYTGNPFFPYGGHWLGGRQFSPVGDSALLNDNQEFVSWGSDFKSWVTFPWRLLMPGNEPSQFVGPLVMVLFPLLLVVRFKSPSRQFWGLTAVFSIILGLCVSHLLRFIMPAFLLFFLLSATLLEKKNSPWGRSVILLALFSSVLCLPFFLNASAQYYDEAGIWLGLETRSQYLGRMVQNPYQDLVEWTDQNLPPNAHLLIAGDTRGLYYRRPFLANSVFDEPILEKVVRESADADEVAERVRRLGLNYAVVNIPEGIRVSQDYHLYDMTPAEWERLNTYLAEYWCPIYFKDFRAVYEILPPGSALSPSSPKTISQNPYVVNPFSFFATPAYDFSAALRSRNLPAAQEAVQKELQLFPQEAYWWEKKGAVDAGLKKPGVAFRDFFRADQLGGLTRAGYTQWTSAAHAQGLLSQVKEIQRRAQARYPDAQ